MVQLFQMNNKFGRGRLGVKFCSVLVVAFFLFVNIFGLVSMGQIAFAAAPSGGTTSGGLPTNSSTYNTPSGPCNPADGKICNPIKARSVDVLLTSILTIVKFVAGIVLVIYFILAGFKYVTARGDKTAIENATKMLTWTAVGGAILLGAEVIQRLLSNTISQLGTGL